MEQKYEHILTPIKIGKHVLKNRLFSSASQPHFLQGPETYPAEPLVKHMTDLAKNGASIVTMSNWTNPTQRSQPGDGAHFPFFDVNDPSVENYMIQYTDAIHFYGSIAAFGYTTTFLPGYGVCDSDELPTEFKGSSPDVLNHKGGVKAMTRREMDIIIKDVVDMCKKYRRWGFDAVELHYCYRMMVAAQFLSPITNKRTDEFGGSIENRARFPLMVCRAIKEELGQDFIINAIITGEEEEPGGITVEDTVAFAKMAEGLIDILQIRAPTADLSHPTNFNSKRHAPVTLRVAEAVKASGAKIIVAPIGGYQDPDEIERYLAEGKCDMVGMARAFFIDPQYYEKIIEGRGEDVIPCIRCNICHGVNVDGPWLTACSVNPRVNFAHKLAHMIDPPKRSKKVAVIGGGPAGMNAAIVAAERGHKVTLFEKQEKLGGQLFHTDFPSFKWPLKDFRDFQIRQLNKHGIDVRLGVGATPDMIKAMDFDAVIAAVGAEPKELSIPGLHDENGNLAPHVWHCIDVYGREVELGKKVVVIGGSETGMETAMYLAECGHDVTILSRQPIMAKEANRVHYYSTFVDAWKDMDNLTPITEATTTSVEGTAVRYTDAAGSEFVIDADDVVFSGGMDPLSDLAMSFHASAPEFFMVGDCHEVGNIRTCQRTSFAAASII